MKLRNIESPLDRVVKSKAKIKVTKKVSWFRKLLKALRIVR